MADYTTTSSTQMPAWVQPYAAGYLQRAQSVADMPYQAYGGQRVADLDPYQQQAYGGIYNRAMQGSPVMGAASNSLQGMVQGGGYRQATANPYGPVTAGSNPYSGSNPYLQQQIDAASQDVVRNYNMSVKPQTDTAMQRSGSFGNSGLQQVQAMQQSDLQRNLGNIASGMRMQDYTQQQQLGESALNRGMQAQQFNAGMGESYANRADSAWNAAQGRMLQGMGMAPTYANQDYADLNAMLSAGQGLQSQNQRYLDDAYGRFVESRDYPQQQLNVMRNALGGVNFGSNTTQTQPGTSTAANVIGGALTGAQLYNLLFK